MSNLQRASEVRASGGGLGHPPQNILQSDSLKTPPAKCIEIVNPSGRGGGGCVCTPRTPPAPASPGPGYNRILCVVQQHWF